MKNKIYLAYRACACVRSALLLYAAAARHGAATSE
jgi:hypothetical protein